MIEHQGKGPATRLKTNNGREYISHDFKAYLAEKGIIHDTSSLYTPEQNGLVEKDNCQIVETARSMLLSREGLPKALWAEVAACAILVLNCSSTRTLSQGITPMERWTGVKPNISHLKVFGVDAYRHVLKSQHSKLDAKSTKLIFVGYCDRTKGYRLFDPVTRKISISTDVDFNEVCSSEPPDLSTSSPTLVNVSSNQLTPLTLKQADVVLPTSTAILQDLSTTQARALPSSGTLPSSSSTLVVPFSSGLLQSSASVTNPYSFSPTPSSTSLPINSNIDIACLPPD